MDCKDFRVLINDFLDEKIDSEKVLDRFVKHAENCHECKEELEMFYAVKEGLGNEENYDTKEVFDYNFDRKTNELLQYHKNEIIKHRLIKKMSRWILLITARRKRSATPWPK